MKQKRILTGNSLKTIRTLLGLKGVEVAKELDIQPYQLFQMENGQTTKPTNKVIDHYAKLMKCEKEDILALITITNHIQLKAKY